MNNLFIKNIKVKKARNIIDFEIPLSSDHRKNLMITGKNGSGKSSLLKELRLYINRINNGDIEHYYEFSKNLKALKSQKLEAQNNPDSRKSTVRNLESDIEVYENWLSHFGGTEIEFSDPKAIFQQYKDGEFITLFLEAKRDTTYYSPSRKEKDFFIFKPYYSVDEIAGKYFVQFLINLKEDHQNAIKENNMEAANQIHEWFKVFESNICSLFDSEEIRLEYDSDGYNFNFLENNKAPYNFGQLSDGYSQMLSIVTELIARMKVRRSNSFNVQGIVLIDEIETHLHVELQKKILPFLINFFPNIQFIVTTHSPFILNSIDNSVICDLERKIVTYDLSGYSYSSLVESYFNSDKYSDLLKRKVEQYEYLKAIENPNDEQKETMIELEKYLYELPKFESDELAVKLQQIKLKGLTKRPKK